jgi:excinuclease ABC subunit A
VVEAESPLDPRSPSASASDPRLARDFETIASLAARGDPEEITIHGARTHNLKSVDLTIPRNKLVVITGPSGSGKSSLAFDTLYAEGQRRYVESLSSYARQFLDQLARPDVESIEGLSPAVAIEQKGVGKSPRSTVGTITEIADSLRLLFARAGTAHCWQCGAAISQQGLEEMVDRILALPEGTKIQVLAPVVRGRKGQYKKELEQFRRDGFARARIDGTMRDLAEDIVLARGARHDIEIVVDRIAVKPGVRPRLAESLATALRLADDLALIDVVDGSEGEPGRAGAKGAASGAASKAAAKASSNGSSNASANSWWLSRSGACPTCEISFPELSPRLFSFNNPFGACATCSGLGQQSWFDPRRIVPDPSRTLAEGGDRRLRPEGGARLLPQAPREGRRPSRDRPRHALARAARRGPAQAPRRRSRPRAPDRTPRAPLRRRPRRSRAAARGQRGPRRCATRALSQRAALCRLLGHPPAHRGAQRAHRRPLAPRALGASDHGARGLLRRARLRRRARADRGADPQGGPRAAAIPRRRGPRLSDASSARSVPLGRRGPAHPLATQIGARLSGVLYVLDEPSIGLHARDNDAPHQQRCERCAIRATPHRRRARRGDDRARGLRSSISAPGRRPTAAGSSPRARPTSSSANPTR